MCHDVEPTQEELRDLLAHELLAETPDFDDPELGRLAGTPSFCNEERETEIDLLTDDGGLP